MQYIMLHFTRGGVDMEKITRAINNLLYEAIENIENITKSNVLVVNAPITDELYNFSLSQIEKIKDKKETLSVILTTNGGSAEVAERLVYVFRHHFEIVNFYIPDYAYSAGTILCMSGDDIFMDYQSVLGPIDPQVQNKDGRFVPALGYLDSIQELIDLARTGNISQAEFLILKDFDLAELKVYEQARDLTIDLLKEWLVKYKFKNWETKETTGLKVTYNEKRRRAEQIAQKLSDNKRWHSHGRTLNIEKLTEIGLRINDLTYDKNDLRLLIRELHNLILENIQVSRAKYVVLTKEALK